ncbi:MAG: adenine phosphoribosyltransferase [Candidatus Coatesbacteria bacterium]|nr:adenine phosphoribosyltransferase [Candidatus Coatesbacteria bacterium]
MDLNAKLRDIPDFPKPGIIFKDITPILADADAFREAIDKVVEGFTRNNIDAIVGVEARGFIFAAAAAYKLNCGLLIVRKPGKLPAETVSETYSLEYGTDTIEIHKDAIRPGMKLLLLDDLLATGGTIAACARLVEGLGGKIMGIRFLVELGFLDGRKKLGQYDVDAVIRL